MFTPKRRFLAEIVRPYCDACHERHYRDEPHVKFRGLAYYEDRYYFWADVRAAILFFVVVPFIAILLAWVTKGSE